MNELDTLKAFFTAWEDVAKLPKTKGRPGPEVKAAIEMLNMRAEAVRGWKPTQAVTQAVPSSEAEAYKAMRIQVQEIAPKDTRGQSKPNQAVTVVSG